jgi:hypothetical protein
MACTSNLEWGILREQCEVFRKSGNEQWGRGGSSVLRESSFSEEQRLRV